MLEKHIFEPSFWKASMNEPSNAQTDEAKQKERNEGLNDDCD